jgi:hypothetical protein
MNKKTRSIAVLFALAAGTLVTLASSPASPVKAASTESSAIYKITAVESDATPLGCVVNCPTIKSNTPTFAVQDTIGTTVAAATEIDTFNTSAWDQVAQTSVSIQGGCAIVAGGLKCWGKNMNGQLGNETTTNSDSIPVTATENSVPLTGITDVSTNGLTTCVVTNGALKCVGSGNLPGISSKNFNTYGNTETWTNGVYSSVNLDGTKQYVVYGADNSVLYDTGSVPHTTNTPQSLTSKKWVTITSAGTDVVKVQVGNSNNGSTPDVCVLKSTGLAACAVVTPSVSSTITEVVTTTHDCENGTGAYSSENTTFDNTFETSTECNQSYRQRKNVRVGGSQFSAPVWTFADAEVTGVVDIAMPSDSWGASSVCFAGATTICRTFQSGVFGAKKTVENGENSQAVYMTSGFGPPGLCLYSNNTISCGAGTHGSNGIMTTATKVTAIAVMAKPLNIFFGTIQTMQKLYFLLPSGLLSADGWIFSCSGCQSQSGSVVAPVTAFAASTASDYTYAKSINGATDSADYIPMTIVSGDRKSRSSVAIAVKTASGENLTGISVRWTAPDAPGLLSSSSSSNLTTDETGAARTTVTSGPVTFTLSVPSVAVCPPVCTPGPTTTTSTTTTVAGGTASTKPAGSLSSGATLQAASITVIVPDTGTITITVPDPPAIVSRKISVTLPDGTPVPNATVQLKNNYLTYAYTNSGSSTSTWSSRPRDTKGYLGQMNCAYCFVAPPKYATGVDGSVTFSSFNPSSRSSAYDADVAYDDGELNQNVKKTFASATETVQMPFMASIKVALPDADPATPAKEADADPSTPETDIKTDSTGGVTIETDLVDEDKAPISGVTQSVETVNPGSSCEQGGLVSSTDKVSTICANGGVSASSINKSAIVRAMGVKSSAGCSATMTTKTGSNGKATLVVCPSTSTKYRIRGTGAIASKTICVRVNNIACGVSSSSVNTGTSTNTPTAVVSKIAVMKKGKITSFTTINKTAKVKIPKGAKVALTVAAASKKFCSVSGTSVKAIKPGTCSISVKVTPKATAKVKKPKATTTKIKITIKK